MKLIIYPFRRNEHITNFYYIGGCRIVVCSNYRQAVKRIL